MRKNSQTKRLWLNWTEEAKRTEEKPGRESRSAWLFLYLFFFFLVKSIFLWLSLHAEHEWLHHQRTRCTSPVEMEIPQLGGGNAEWMTKLMSNYSSNLGSWDHKSKQRSWGGRGQPCPSADICVCWLRNALLGATEKPHVVLQIQRSFSINNSHTIILKLN